MWEEQYIASLASSSKRHEVVFLVRFGRVACRVVTASFSKWPSEPISRLGKKPLV